MAGDDDETASAPKGRRRRKPPVIELAATEIPAATPRAKSGAPNAASDPAVGAPTGDGEERTLEWRALLRFAPAAIAAAAIVGAVVAILVVFLFDRGSDPRLAKLVSDVAALNQRLDALGKPDGADPTVALALADKIERLAATVQEAERRLSAVESRPLPQALDLSPVNARLGRLEAGIAERPAIEAAALESLSKRLAMLEERMVALATSARASVAPALAAEVVALGALRDVLNSGAPFATELAAVRALLAERAVKLQPLERAATTGLPTTAQLARRFAELAPVIAREPDAEGGYLSRLVTSASRLVELRPVGEIKGETAAAVVARIEMRLRHDDLAVALAEADRLPAPAKTTAAEWIAAARAKRNADVALKELIAAALLALGSERKP